MTDTKTAGKRYRFLADSWVRTDPLTVDDVRPKKKRIAKGEILPAGYLLEDEIEFLTNGPFKQLEEVIDDAPTVAVTGTPSGKDNLAASLRESEARATNTKK